MHTPEDQLAKQIEEIHALGTQDKNIDTAALVLNALQVRERSFLSLSQKRLAYAVSIALPPLGLLFAVKFYLASEDDARHAAYACLVLTAISVLLVIIFTTSLFSGSSSPASTVEQLQPSDVYELMR